MQSFTISKNAYNHFRTRVLINSVPKILFAMIVGIFIGSLKTSRFDGKVNMFPITAPVVTVIILAAYYYELRRKRNLFNTYKITIDNRSVTREQFDTRIVKINFEDVKTICCDSKGNMVIIGKSRGQLIIIPSEIEGHEYLMDFLKRICRFTKKDGRHFTERHPNLIGLISIFLLLIIFLINSKLILIVTGILLIAILWQNFCQLRLDPNIDNKTKNRAAWVFVIIGIVIALITLRYLDLEHKWPL